MRGKREDQRREGRKEKVGRAGERRKSFPSLRVYRERPGCEPKEA